MSAPVHPIFPTIKRWETLRGCSDRQVREDTIMEVANAVMDNGHITVTVNLELSATYQDPD
jgi:hypothetical protein